MIISQLFKTSLFLILCWNISVFGMDLKVAQELQLGKEVQQNRSRVKNKEIKSSRCSTAANFMALSFLGLALGGAGGYLLKISNIIDNPDTPNTPPDNYDGSFFCAYSDGTFAGKGDINAVNRNWYFELTNCGGWLNATSQVQTTLLNSRYTAELALYGYQGLNVCNTPNQKTSYCAFLDSNPANQTDNLGSFIQDVWNALHNGNAKAVNLKHPKTKKAKIPKNRRDFFRLNQGRKR